MDNNLLLEIKDLRVSFPLDEGTVRAVEGVNLTMRRGEVLGVVGESGCGKSITAHSILRIIPHPGRIDAGQILFHPAGAIRCQWKRGCRPGESQSHRFRDSQDPRAKTSP